MSEQEIVRMTVAGWAFLVVSCTAMTGLTAYCISKVLGTGKKKFDPDETPLE